MPRTVESACHVIEEGDNMLRKMAAGVFVGMLVIAAFGCGSTKTLTRAQFVKRADAVCRSFQTQVSALVKQLPGKAGTTAAAKAAFAKVVQGDARRLAAVHPPKELQSTYAKFTVARSVQLNAMVAQAKGDQTATARGARAAETAGPLVRQLGLERC
jgi:hypothetical protein